MSKTLVSKSDVFAGSVTLSDPLTLLQEAAFEEANAAYQVISGRVRGMGSSAIVAAFLPGVFACVEKWELKGIPSAPTLDSWPTRPRAEVIKLVAWLIEEIGKLYTDSVETEAPNA